MSPGGLPQSPWQAGGVLRAAAWFGLVAGLLESLSHLIRYHAAAVPILMGWYLLWMPAVSNLLFFSALGIILAPLATRWPGVLTPTRLIGLLATLAAMAALRVLDGYLGVITVDILALGVGVQVATRLGPASDRFARFLGPALAALLAAVLVAGVSIELHRIVTERRTLAGLPAPRPQAPNVLLLVLDTVRAFNLSAYGYHLPTTPVLDTLSAHGVRFGRAYSTAPWTLPSHSSMFTGRWAHEMPASWQTPLDTSDSTLAEVLAGRGYRTGAVVANLAYTSRWTGLDRGFAHYAAHEISLPQILRTGAFTRKLYNTRPFKDFLPPAWRDYRRKTGREVSDALLAWLDRTPDRPFFAFLNYLDAHDPYLPQAPFDTAFSTVVYPPPPPPIYGGQHKDDRPRAMRPYDQAIAYLDAELGRLLDGLARRGLLEHTLVIVTSDHGEEFGEHGFYGHGHTLYQPALAVPLIMAWPGQLPGGIVVEERVSLRALPATVLDLADGSGNSPFPGRSLARFWQTEHPDPDTILVSTRWARNRPAWDATSRGDLQGVVAGGFSLLRDVDLSAELFDLSADSAERHSLAGQPDWAPVVRTLTRVLEREVGPPQRAPVRH